MGDWLSALEEWLDYLLSGGEYADHPPYPYQDPPNVPPLPADTPRSPAQSPLSQLSARSLSPPLPDNSQHPTSSSSRMTTDPSSSEKSQLEIARHPPEQQEEPLSEKSQHETVMHLPQQLEEPLSEKSQHKTVSHSPEKQEPLSENPQRSWKRSLHQRLEEKPVQMAYRLVQYLANCLPIRSFFAFQVLLVISSFSNKSVTATLVSVLGIVCFASCFTDSSNVHGRVYFRHVTCGQSQTAYRLPRYGIRPSDFVHAATSMAVYAALVFSDRSVMDTLYPSAPRQLKSLLQWARLVVVVFSALLLLIFPTYRRGIGFAVIDAATSCGSDENLKGSREQKNRNVLP